MKYIKIDGEFLFVLSLREACNKISSAGFYSLGYYDKGNKKSLKILEKIREEQTTKGV